MKKLETGGKELRSLKEGYLVLMVLEVSKRSFLYYERGRGMCGKSQGEKLKAKPPITELLCLWSLNLAWETDKAWG